MITEKEAKETYDKLSKRIYKMVKRFEKENAVFITDIEYKGTMNSMEGSERSEIETEMWFFK